MDNPQPSPKEEEEKECNILVFLFIFFSKDAVQRLNGGGEYFFAS